MEIEELLSRAWSAVEKAGIPEPLQEYAFKEAITRLSGQTPASTSASTASGRTSSQKKDEAEEPEGAASGGSGPTKTDDELFKKFAEEAEIDVVDLERVFYFKDGEPHLNGPRTKLGKTTSDQAKTVAVALTAAYDYALDRKPLDDSIVRAEATRLKCDVGGHWAKHMNKAVGVSWIGASRQKQFKVKTDTQETLKRIVAAALGSPVE